MKVEAWKAITKYCEVWEIVAYKDNAIYKTKNTGKHCLSEAILPEPYMKVTISAKPGELVEINLMEI